MPSLSLDSTDREREVGEVHIISYRVLLLHIYLFTFHLYRITSIYLFTLRKSYGTDKENLFNNQDFIKLVIIYLILLTLTFDLRVILKGELRSQSLSGVKRLINFMVSFYMEFSKISTKT